MRERLASHGNNGFAVPWGLCEASPASFPEQTSAAGLAGEADLAATKASREAEVCGCRRDGLRAEREAPGHPVMEIPP